jgi:hypothetical protein
MEDWSTIGGIAALLSIILLPLVVGLTLSNFSVELIQSAWRYLVGKLYPSMTVCDRLIWDDILPDHPFHECATVPLCPHPTTHTKQERCWKAGFCHVFSRSWKHTRSTVAKPASLSLKKEYICTDIRTIQAFLLATSEKELFGLAFMEVTSTQYHFRYKSSVVTLQTMKDGTLTAHLEGHLHNNLTKGDVQGLMLGYPPTYRETIKLQRTGFLVPHPIRTPADVSRAGWLVAIGIGKERAIPIARYDRNWENKAVVRALTVVRCRLRSEFPLDENVNFVLNGLTILLNNSSNSFGRRLRDFKKIIDMSADQAIYGMNFFNEGPRKELSEDDLRRLTPEFRLALVDAVHAGAAWVIEVELEKDTFHVPFKEMDPTTRVFLTDCTST